MGLITDELVIEAVRCSGTATSTMVYDWIASVLDAPRDVISSRAGKKLKQLVKYGLLCSMKFEKRTWYYAPETIPNPIPMKPIHGTEKLKDYVDCLDYGEHITVDDAMRITGCTRSHVRRTLSELEHLSHDLPNTYCKAV